MTSLSITRRRPKDPHPPDPPPGWKGRAPRRDEARFEEEVVNPLVAEEFEVDSKDVAEEFEVDPKDVELVDSANPLVAEAALQNGLVGKDFYLINTPDSNGQYPIHSAIEKSNLDNVEILLKHGANLGVVNKDGQTPLMVAANLFLPDINGSGNYERRMLNIIKMLLDHENPILLQDKKGDTIFHIFARKKFVIISRALDKDSFLQFKAIMKILCTTDGISTPLETQNKCGHTALHVACLYQNYPYAEMLIKYGADINADTGTYEDENCKMLFYDSSHEGNEPPIYGKPIHLACVKTIGSGESLKYTLKLLLANKASLNSVSIEGNTPLHMAFAYENHLIVEVIERTDQSIFNKKNEKGLTPILMIPSEYFFHYCIIFGLIDNFDLNATDDKGNTIFHLYHSIIDNDDTIKGKIKKLIESGKIDPTIKNDDLETVSDIDKKLTDLFRSPHVARTHLLGGTRKKYRKMKSVRKRKFGYKKTRLRSRIS